MIDVTGMEFMETLLHPRRRLLERNGRQLPQALGRRVEAEPGRLERRDTEYRFDSFRAEDDPSRRHLPEDLDLDEAERVGLMRPVGQFVGSGAYGVHPDVLKSASGGEAVRGPGVDYKHGLIRPVTTSERTKPNLDVCQTHTREATTDQ